MQSLERKYKGNQSGNSFIPKKFTPNLLAIYFQSHPHDLLSKERKYKGNQSGNSFIPKIFTPNLLTISFPNPPALFTFQRKEIQRKSIRKSHLSLKYLLPIYL